MKKNKTRHFSIEEYEVKIKEMKNKEGIYFVIAQENIFVREKPKNRRISYSKNQRIQQFLIRKFNSYGNVKKHVLYIGSSKKLKSRITALYNTMFSSLGTLSHEGGKYLSWIDNYNELEIEYIYCKNCKAKETKRLASFAVRHGFLPLANIKH